MWPCRRSCRALLLALVVASTAAVAPPAWPQAAAAASSQPPVFGTAVELVRLDAVVLDREGRPVTGLTRDDFEVEEEGRTQAITSFEPVVVGGALHPPADEPPRLSAARLRAPSEGRCLLVYFDDIHVRQDSIERVRQALRRLLADLRDGDWVTIVAPEQEVWWTARNGWEYRQLASVVERLKGQGSGDSYADWQAMRALEHGLGGAVAQRGVMAGGGAAPVGPGQDDPVAGVGKPDPVFLAEENVALIKRRTGMTLGGLRQGLEALVALRGHKSLVLVSEGFLLLPRMPGYDELIDLARRANVAIHFLDPKGLEVGLPDASVPSGEGPPIGGPGPGTQLALTTGDAQGIAEVTGGHAFGGIDAAVALRRVLAESEAYYLLGYAPDHGAAGQRKVKVRVRGEGLKVLARTRYFVSDATARPPAPKRPGKDDKGLAVESPAFTAMRSLADTTDLPLRVATLFFEPNRKGEVATMLATEVVPPPGPDGPRLFKLVSEARPRDGGTPVLDQFEGTPMATSGVAVILARQWNLTPGVWQLRLLVEDTVAKRIGTLVHTFEVPEAKRFRISTPILTAEIEDPNGKRKPKVSLVRTFRTGSVLYCQYSAYGAPVAGRHDWVPHVFGSWTLRRGEEAVRESPPTLIQPAPDGRVTRTLGINLQGLQPGEYALVLSVRDETTGGRLTRTEPFTVAP